MATHTVSCNWNHPSKKAIFFNKNLTNADNDNSMNMSAKMEMSQVNSDNASPRLWNQLPDSFRQPRQSCLDSPPHSPISSSLLSSALSSSITPSLFHSRLKTFLTFLPALPLPFCPLLVPSSLSLHPIYFPLHPLVVYTWIFLNRFLKFCKNS